MALHLDRGHAPGRRDVTGLLLAAAGERKRYLCRGRVQRWWEPKRRCLDAFLDNGRAEGYYLAMSKTTDDILNNAMRLSTTERAELAAALLASLDGEPEDAVEAAWATEIQRRIERVQSGEAKGRPWSEVRERLERRRE
jgi:putative addiction module component (TIGR02574 family)